MPSLRIRNPGYRTMMRARVSRTEQLTPHFVRITLTSEHMDRFEYLGFDQAVRLFLPRAGQQDLQLPAVTGHGWIAKFFMTPKSSRPYVRNYTIRACRPHSGEMDIEFVTLGDHGPASAWAARARPGDEVGLLPEGIQYLPSERSTAHLLVADESAVPAVMSILDHAPAGYRAEVFCEVPSAADIRSTQPREGVRTHWLHRDGQDLIPGRLALEAASRADLPADELYCFLAGESGLPTGLRRHLVSERGIPKTAVTFVGYWKHGRAAPG